MTAVNAKVFRPAILTACLVAAIASVTYLSLLSINPDSNGIPVARAIELGDLPSLASPNHMLFELLGFAVFKSAGVLGYSGKAFLIVQVLAALCGGVTLGAAYLAAREMSASPRAALAATAWLGTSWAFLNWSTNVAYIGMAAMMTALSTVFVWRRDCLRCRLFAGITAALSVLAWQGNIFLLPALVAAVWMQPAAKAEKRQHSAYIVGSFILVLCVAYGAVAYYLQIRSFGDFVHLVTSYGGGRLPLWGRWDWHRLSDMAQSWIHSAIGWIALRPVWFLSRPLTFGTFFARLAPLALAVFFLVPVVLRFRTPKDSIVMCNLLAIALYVPFIVWWDPFETKWLLLPNLFLVWTASRLWTLLGNRQFCSFILFAAIGVLSASNLIVYAVPSHRHLSFAYTVANCVGQRLQPEDLYLATDWAWADYMSYTYDRHSEDAIGLFVASGLDKKETFRALSDTVRNTQQSGGNVYMTDPSFYGAGFAPLTQLTGITTSELDSHFSGKIAFTCQGWPIRKLDNTVYERTILSQDVRQVFQLDRSEAASGDYYRLRINGFGETEVSILYSIDGRQTQSFDAHLNSESEIRFHISDQTAKGTYRFLGFRRTHDQAWIPADATITIK